MPLYEYKCRECGHQFEKLASMSVADDAQVCPECGVEACQRQYSAFASNIKAAGPATGNCGGSSSRFT